MNNLIAIEIISNTIVRIYFDLNYQNYGLCPKKLNQVDKIDIQLTTIEKRTKRNFRIVFSLKDDYGQALWYGHAHAQGWRVNKQIENWRWDKLLNIYTINKKVHTFKSITQTNPGNIISHTSCCRGKRKIGKGIKKWGWDKKNILKRS